MKSLGSKSHPKAYLKLLESTYATVKDGDELFAWVLNTNQNVGESTKVSHYCTSNSVISRKGIAPGDTDNSLDSFAAATGIGPFITSLQLEQCKHEPPSFAELFLHQWCLLFCHWSAKKADRRSSGSNHTIQSLQQWKNWQKAMKENKKTTRLQGRQCPRHGIAPGVVLPAAVMVRTQHK